MIFRKAKARPPRAKLTIGGIVAAAAGAYFFDPSSGARRRALVRDKVFKLFNRGSQKIERTTRYLGAQGRGIKDRVVHSGPEEVPPNDAALAAKVESEIYQVVDIPKGRINVNSEEGVVYLRGELPDARQIDELEQAVRKVTGVIDVRNLVHQPGEPAPTA